MSEQETTPTPTDSTANDTSTTGLRHRVLGLRGVIAVAVASLIIGGGGGLALGTLSSGADGQGGGFPGGQGGQGGPGGPGGPGFQRPAQAQVQVPRDDVEPDGESDTSGDTSGASGPGD